MCYKQCQWRNSLNTKQLLPRQRNRSEWTCILSSSVRLRIIHVAFSLNLRYQLPVITSPNLVYVYIYRYMTYMGLQICVSTHGDLRLKMSKQVRSIWKISIHLNSLFIFLSPHENNDYSITFSTNLHQILQVFQASHWGLAQMSLKGTPSIRSMVSTRDWASGDHPKDDVWTRKMFFHVWN